MCYAITVGRDLGPHVPGGNRMHTLDLKLWGLRGLRRFNLGSRVTAICFGATFAIFIYVRVVREIRSSINPKC